MRTLTAADGAAVYFKAIVLDLLIQLVGSVVVMIITMTAGLSDAAAMTVNFILMALIQAVFLLAVYLHVRKKKLALGYPVKPVRWFTGCLAFLCAAVCVVCFILPAQWFAVLLENIGYRFSDTLSFDTPLNIALGAVVTVLIAPVCEELVFRGALLGGLVKKYGVAASVLLSGLAFSLMHMNPEQTVYQFFLGCVCAYFAICSRSALPAMLLHSGNNLIALILEFMPSSGAAFEPSPLWIALTFILAAAGIAAAYLIGRLMLRFESEPSGGRILAFEKNYKTKERVADFRTLLAVRKQEDALDESDVTEGRRRNEILGKKTHVILLCLGLGVCAFMWLMVFMINISGVAV